MRYEEIEVPPAEAPEVSAFGSTQQAPRLLLHRRLRRQPSTWSFSMVEASHNYKYLTTGDHCKVEKPHASGFSFCGDFIKHNDLDIWISQCIGGATHARNYPIPDVRQQRQRTCMKKRTCLVHTQTQGQLSGTQGLVNACNKKRQSMCEVPAVLHANKQVCQHT